MRKLDYEAAKLTVAEQEDYSYCLTRQGEKIELFKVVLPVTVFVLAEDEDRAISQAQCIVGCETRDTAGCSSERIPFGIRGWSKQLF